MSELSGDKLKLFRKFKKCVDQRSIESMDKKLYHFFMNHAGFIAHYNIEGFKSEYEDIRFLEWFKCFSEPNWMFHHRDEYDPLRRACEAYAKEKATAVYEHFQRMEYNRKVALMQKLEKELKQDSLNYTKDSKEGIPREKFPLFFESDNGQLSLFS